LQARAEQAERQARDCEHQRIQREQDCSQARIDLARVEEQLSRQRERLAQLENDTTRTRQELDELDANESQLVLRRRSSLLTILAASTVLADCCRIKESAEQRLAVLAAERDHARNNRRMLSEKMQTINADRQELLNQMHSCEMREIQIRGRCDGICERLREDYQVDLAELARSAATDQAVTPENAQTQIDELKRKLARLGAVNMEALQELTDLEKRSVELDAQHRDLLTSQGHLLEIIGRINQDSKKLFTDAFASIRTHFQELFRRLFGGGMADIVLEDENDILECGIEINARPPGKELRSISLMSGGERTLTCIALLMAIFRSKPSPFCLLDEVDAALDEANNNRLASVLRDFLSVSQFIVVTHKKRTMAVADALYGVTMQESGVSKQISVRFEDWPDEKTQDHRAAAG
jgi:chromosome segregation protein